MGVTRDFGKSFKTLRILTGARPFPHASPRHFSLLPSLSLTPPLRMLHMHLGSRVELLRQVDQSPAEPQPTPCGDYRS